MQRCERPQSDFDEQQSCHGRADGKQIRAPCPDRSILLHGMALGLRSRSLLDPSALEQSVVLQKSSSNTWTVVPTTHFGACGGCTTSASARANAAISELSCDGMGRTSTLPSGPVSSVARA